MLLYIMPQINENDPLHSFWEKSFQNKKAMWGMQPAHSAEMAAILFEENKAKNILIPGLGYGRNSKPFLDKDMEVTGIEISETAISLAKKFYGAQLSKIIKGSVEDMPFDNNLYDGIYCYSLIHLLDAPVRASLIEHCYNQLSTGGHMVFVSVSKNFPSFGQGIRLSENRFETTAGVQLYFYEPSTIIEAFTPYGLVDFQEIVENKKATDASHMPDCWYIVCKK